MLPRKYCSAVQLLGVYPAATACCSVDVGAQLVEYNAGPFQQTIVITVGDVNYRTPRVWTDKVVLCWIET